MTSRLLLVEPSTTMRFVLDNYVQSLGYTVVSVGDYHDGVEAMRNQFQSFDDDFEAVILGWPSVAVREADTLTALLEQDDFQTLPVLVMSTDQRAETRAWVADRPNSAMLAWKSYESVQELLTPLIKSGVAHTADRPPHDTGAVSIKFDEALALCETQSFDIAIVDFYLQDETGDEVCRSLLNADPAIVCAILTSAYSDPIIKLSLRAGAVDCLFKNEAGELLLARIDENRTTAT